MGILDETGESSYDNSNTLQCNLKQEFSMNEFPSLNQKAKNDDGNNQKKLMGVWSAITGSLLVLLIAAKASLDQASNSGVLIPQVNETLKMILTVLALTLTIMTLFIHKFLKKKTKSSHIHLSQNPNLNLSFNEIFIITVVKLALSEAVSILGFVMATQERQFELMLPFWVSSIALNLYHFPNIDRLRKLYQ